MLSEFWFLLLKMIYQYKYTYLLNYIVSQSVEASGQADHESTDDFSKDEPDCLTINDLILFSDNDDVPRIPSKLFDEVCQIRVPGSPGPVYLSLLKATIKFFFIIMFLGFVFIVVLSFGEVYRMSGTSQMLATMAGGFTPFIFSYILKPANPDPELGSVSYKGKLEEVIKNFRQIWPMYDFPFDVNDKREPSDSGNDPESDSNDDKKHKDNDKKKSDEKKRFQRRCSLRVKNNSYIERSGDELDNGSCGIKDNMDSISEEKTLEEGNCIKQKLKDLHLLTPDAEASVDILILLPPGDECSPSDINDGGETDPLVNGLVETV